MRAVPTLRIFIAWLLLLALPLQALAAASMKPCVQAQQQHAAVFTMTGPADVQAHGQHHGHGHGQHPADPVQAATGDGHPAAQDPAPHHFATSASDDAGHTCAICAGLCHGMAAATEPTRLRLGAPSGQGPGDAPQRIASVTTALPDKPPRA